MDIQYVDQISPQTAFGRQIAASYCIIILCGCLLIHCYQLSGVLHISYCSNCSLVLTTYCSLHWLIPWCDIPVTQWVSRRNKIYWSGNGLEMKLSAKETEKNRWEKLFSIQSSTKLTICKRFQIFIFKYEKQWKTLKIKDNWVFFIVRLLLYQKDLITITKSATAYFLLV